MRWSSKRLTLGSIANLCLIGTAVFMVWSTVRGRANERRPEPAVLFDWEGEFDAGVVMGPTDAPLHIIELMDFQCPHCASWAARVDSLIADHPDAVRVSFHHWPLPQHPHSLPAAVASECAHRQGVFAEFARVTFEDQQQIGSRPWRSFAERAGVADLEQFEACNAMPVDSFPRIQYGAALAERVRASGTPTVWVNGEYRRPSLAELRRLVTRLMDPMGG